MFHSNIRSPLILGNKITDMEVSLFRFKLLTNNFYDDDDTVFHKVYGVAKFSVILFLFIKAYSCRQMAKEAMTGYLKWEARKSSLRIVTDGAPFQNPAFLESIKSNQSIIPDQLRNLVRGNN